jgi:16S rRNA (uracil1498-N3)-methyltransferase
MFCYEEERKKTIRVLLCRNKTNGISVLTGPEGGYTPEEAALCVENGWEAVTLGERILRCETAPLFVLAAIAYERMEPS